MQIVKNSSEQSLTDQQRTAREGGEKGRGAGEGEGDGRGEGGGDQGFGLINREVSSYKSRPLSNQCGHPSFNWLLPPYRVGLFLPTAGLFHPL